MQSVKRKLNRPVIVEGRYDKIKITSVFDAVVITTDGFGIFKNEEKRDFIKTLAKERGLIVCTDSDGAGKVIRGHLNGLVPPELITNVYIPRIKGKEKRKTRPSAEGLLGVEGVDTETLLHAFMPFVSEKENPGEKITPADLYELGLCGKQNSASLREKISDRLGLPPLSSKAFCEAVNFLYSKERVEKELEKIGEENG